MAAPVTLTPVWHGEPKFSEHSYRSFAADGAGRELILFQNIGYTHAEWTFRDRAGTWSAQGQLKWPWGAEYDQPEPIRVCYPNVAVRDRAVHFFGVSDVVEPYKAWREFKRELTGQQWDYDFRRLFYTWTRDVTREPEAVCGVGRDCEPGQNLRLALAGRPLAGAERRCASALERTGH